MRNKVIYLDANGKLKAFAAYDVNQFDEVYKTITSDKILYLDDQVNHDNVPDELKETFGIFLKTCLKSWSASYTLTNPVRGEMIIDEIKQVEETVVETPVKKTRKKKGTK